MSVCPDIIVLIPSPCNFFAVAVAVAVGVAVAVDVAVDVTLAVAVAVFCFVCGAIIRAP